MEAPISQFIPLEIFARCLKKVPDPRSKHGTSHPFPAAVDGKVAKQMKDENGDPILILNVFAQTMKLHLASWSVRGDKTNVAEKMGGGLHS